MFDRNNGPGEANIIQNQFTAYLLVAVRRTRKQYLKIAAQQQRYERTLDMQELVYPDLPLGLPLLMQLENHQLRQALERAREHELRILLSKILENKTFAEIAFELGISLTAVASVYYSVNAGNNLT